MALLDRQAQMAATADKFLEMFGVPDSEGTQTAAPLAGASKNRSRQILYSFDWQVLQNCS
jgi:hypothetical protein